MAMPNDNHGQLYTIEGIIASLILIGVLLFIIQANSIVIPQTEKISDMKLQQRANDILTNLEISNGSPSNNDLKTYVETWHGNDADPSNMGIAAGEPELQNLNKTINSMLLPYMHYSLSLSYNETSGPIIIRPIIMQDQPGDNSVVATRIVTLYPDDDQLSNFWKSNARYTNNPRLPIIVEVKIVCWYL
jgi:hypothetical protein